MNRDHGDMEIRWNPANDDEVEIARQQFEIAQRKGMYACKVSATGLRDHIREFRSRRRERIVMAPQLVGG